MKAFITGGAGFVGKRLTKALLGRGFECTIIGRRANPGGGSEGVRYIAADASKPGAWQEEVTKSDVVFNLAGANVFARWTEDYKKLLRDSRILTTRNVVDALPSQTDRAATLISTSGLGYYGFTGDEPLHEDAARGSDFLARLAGDWEAEALRAADKGVRAVTTRYGVVFGRDEGALPQMVRPFKFFVGGKVGSGRQWVPWIHIEDLCRAALFVMETETVRGPVNFCSPYPVRNSELAEQIGKTLRRPSFMPAPGFMVKLLLGEFGSVILEGQRAVPGVLTKAGFEFKFPTVDKALTDLLKG